MEIEEYYLASSLRYILLILKLSQYNEQQGLQSALHCAVPDLCFDYRRSFIAMMDETSRGAARELGRVLCAKRKVRAAPISVWR